jgi:uncharacterized membrane protein
VVNGKHRQVCYGFIAGEKRMAEQNSMVVFTLDSKDKAHDLLKKLRDMDIEDENIEIKEAAFAHKVSRGRIKLEQSADLGGGRGALGGGAIGVIAGTMVAGPLGAAVGGVVGGAVAGLYAKLRDSGVNDRFMKDVSKSVEEGKTALFIMYTGEVSQAMLGTLRDYNASLIHGTLPAQAETVVVETLAAEGEEVAPEIEVFTEEATEADIEPVEEVIAPIVAHAAEPPPPAPTAPDLAPSAPTPENLTVIEGIGPKVNGALTAAGITTYSRLANASEAELREALLRAGVIPPKSLETWPKQAKLASQGEWQELYKLNAKRKLAAKKKTSA